MMSVQGAMTVLVQGSSAKPGSSPNALADSPVSFEQLLMELVGGTEAKSPSGELGDEAQQQVPAQEEQQDHWASLSMGALAAMLAHTMGTDIPIATKQEHDASSVVNVLQPRLDTKSQAVGGNSRVFSTMTPKDKPQPLFQAGMAATSSSELGAQVAGARQGALSSELEALTQLLQELQINASVATKAPTQPKGWGQLERFWVFRGKETPVVVDEIALGDSPSGSPAEQVGRVPSLRALVAQRSESREIPLLGERDVIAEADDQKMSEHLIFHLGLDRVVGQEMEQTGTPEVIYQARPGQPLQQQLEQGLGVGVRQLRIFRSEEGLTVRMHLYPESLGEVRVELKLEGNVLTAQLRTYQPQAAEALRQELPLLRENLINQGFTQVFLGAETAQQFDHWAGQRQQRFQEEHQRRPQRVGIVRSEETEEPMLMSIISSRLDYKL